MSPTQKSAAKSRAKRAGRHYPNLVDNMHEAAASPRRKAAKKKAKKKARKK